MSFWNRLNLAERLFSRMADVNGADLAYSMQAGDLSPEQYRNSLLACSGCSEPDTCEKLLRRGDKGVPDFCRNGALIERLASVSPD